jgi:hypothetical protein
MSDTRDLHTLLVEADRALQPMPATQPTISLRALELRNRRKQSARVTTVGVSVLFMAMVPWLLGRNSSFTSHPTSHPTDHPTATTKCITLDRTLDRLKREANCAVRAGKAWQHERTRAALWAEYHQLRQASLVSDIVSPVERAAQMNLTLAQELERRFGANDHALTEYRRIVTRFPDTKSARIAAERLAHIDSPT